jgi:hypothetical protein
VIELALTPQTYDGVVSALTGNGELCTTVCPTGYHTPPDQAEDKSHRTQHFVMAGRRRSGPQHPLIHLGTLSRTVKIDGESPTVRTWKQTLDVEAAVVVSEWEYDGLLETSRSCVLLQDNVFLVDTVLRNTSDSPREIRLEVRYDYGEPDGIWGMAQEEDGRSIDFRIEDHQGLILFRSRLAGGESELSFHSEPLATTASLTATLNSGESTVLSSWLHFSDRTKFEFPVDRAEIDAAVERHETGWAEFWSRSEVVTGDERVDAFRKTSLYTLRCQCTPWSIPATLSSEYWGGGAFHDEMYPFFGLLSSNYPDLAERIPHFRLATLPKAIQRARGRGALYPWSSTENGDERDPHGHWLTERFHLGQFAVCIHALWLYEQNASQLEDLYPVLRELARYFELNMLERNDKGRLGIIACTDFDESVGKVKNGPFTLCAAIATLERAAEAAGLLGLDSVRAKSWLAHSFELWTTLKEGNTGAKENGDEVYQIPQGKSLHYSILGPTFPFRLDVSSPRAKNSAALIHEVCRSTKGWKPGFSEVFEGSNWMWMAGHVGAVHALQGSADLAWDAIRRGVESAGAFLSPNEHRNADDQVVVPWFTTGCGAWLYALNAMFVQVDEDGTKLLPAVPAELLDFSVSGLRAGSGVLISAERKGGALKKLTARAPKRVEWRYWLPEWLAKPDQLGGLLLDSRNGWYSLSDKLPANTEVSLLV